jgi:5-formyltetrahydrofolate cyclo-ligase
MLFFVSTLHVMDKKKLRQYYKDKRKSIQDDSNASFSLAIANRLLELPLWEHTYFHLFLSSRQLGEVDTDYILTLLQGRDKQVVVPRMQTEHELKHILLTDATLIGTNRWGIPEPQEGIEVLPEQLDVVFVPLLAFDEMGNRIGYGKGYYDRFLVKCKPSCLKIGVSFFSAEKSIPQESTDIGLDYCVTPEQVYSFR